MAIPAAIRALRQARKKGPLRVSGRFATQSQWLARNFPGYEEGIESYLVAQLGRAPTGLNWVQIAAKYADRFSDFLQDAPG